MSGENERREARTDADSVDRLLELAGPRPELGEADLAELKEAVRPVWQDKVRTAQKRRQRRRSVWRLAAVALMSAGGLLLWSRANVPVQELPPPVRVAVLEHLVGDVTGSGPDFEARAGGSVSAGTAVVTSPDAAASLRLAGGPAVRLDADTALRFDSATRLILDRGAVYLDTGSETGRSLEVVTRYGVARDIGTRFEVRMLQDGWQVRVRDGEVELAGEQTSHTVGAGRTILLRGNSATRGQVAAHGPEWGWVLEAVPPFELEGRTLSEFLAWVSHETGLEPRYQDPALESEVAQSVIRSSARGLRPDLAPAAVLPAFGLRHRIEDGVLRIERDDPS